MKSVVKAIGNVVAIVVLATFLGLLLYLQPVTKEKKS